MKILGDVLGLEEKFRDIVEFDGDVNLMKGALVVSDHVSTVSPNYKNELQHDFFAFGLGSVINSIFYKMSGVINGIDYDVFSPKCDTDIYYSYDKSNLNLGKSINKSQFQKDVGLRDDEKVPLIVLITRLAEGKGIDLFLHVAEELLSENVQIAVLGTGEERYENALREIANRNDNFKALIKFDRALSKQMYAAADIFLMPSKSEPCGLSQMIACSYGAVPIVRSVGGLYDTIKNWNGKCGNGLRFDNYNAHELLYTVKKAISLFRSDDWDIIRNNAFDSKFTWTSSAAKYMKIYNNLLNW